MMCFVACCMSSKAVANTQMAQVRARKCGASGGTSRWTAKGRWTVSKADEDYTGKPFAQEFARLLRAEVTVAKRSELHRFTVIPKRWVVERSFSWLGKCQYCGKTAKNA